MINLTTFKKIHWVRSSIVAVLLTLINPLSSARADWVLEPSGTVYFFDEVGFSEDGSSHSGWVMVRMDQVVVSGKFKILTTLLDVIPAEGFDFSVKKDGGYNSSVEIEFTSDTCQSRFSFLYKPGLTRIDYGRMECK